MIQEETLLTLGRAMKTYVHWTAASLTACMGAIAGSLWSLDVEGPGFDSVTEYLSS